MADELAGVLWPDGGEALIDGEAVFENPAAKRRLYFVPDNPYFEPGATLLSTARRSAASGRGGGSGAPSHASGEVNTGSAPWRRPNTTSRSKAHGRRRNEATAPPSVCTSGRP